MSRRVGTFLLLAALAACDVPNFEGPQLQEPPQGFILQPDPTSAQSVFTELPVVYHDRWVQPEPPFSTITINGHAGTLTLEDVMAAQDARRASETDPDMVFGAIEALPIDGREAWGWEEHVASPSRGMPWVAYRAMVPYEDVSYAIEIETEDPLLKAGAPASLQAIATTFAVGKTVYNWPLIAIVAGLLLFALYIIQQRSRAKAAQLRSIKLVKVEQKETPEDALDEEDREEPVGAAASYGHAAPRRPSPE